jgi:hypothetical protein
MCSTGNGQFSMIHSGSWLKMDVIIRKKTLFDRSRFALARMLRHGESYRTAFASIENVIIKKTEYCREN